MKTRKEKRVHSDGDEIEQEGRCNGREGLDCRDFRWQNYTNKPERYIKREEALMIRDDEYNSDESVM